MTIYQDFEASFYSDSNKILGNCYTIQEKDKLYYYEFFISKQEACIHTNDIKYIESAVEAFHNSHKEVTTFYTKDHAFYKKYEDVFTFMLPIQILQPSAFFVDEEKIKSLDPFVTKENTYFPVSIVQEEYVLLDKHEYLYILVQNDVKMVNVYMQNAPEHILDFIYLAKENNIFSIKNVKALPHEEYEQYWQKFLEDYFMNY